MAMPAEAYSRSGAGTGACRAPVPWALPVGPGAAQYGVARGAGQEGAPLPAGAERQESRAAVSADAARHRHGLHEVLARLDRASQECFGRLAAGEPPGFPACRVPSGSTRAPTKRTATAHGWTMVACYCPRVAA